jgi:hypothetical protein
MWLLRIYDGDVARTSGGGGGQKKPVKKQLRGGRKVTSMGRIESAEIAKLTNVEARSDLGSVVDLD